MKVYPVVQISDPAVAVQQSRHALEAGADGVYLISHSGSTADVLRVLNQLRDRCLSAFIGVNLLGIETSAALRIVVAHGRASGVYPDALWSDDIRQHDGRHGAAMCIKSAHPELSRLVILGGVAFKYTTSYTEDPKLAAAQARELEPYVDVVTTSGAGTGIGPPVAKLAAMRAAVVKPLAVASGVSNRNISDYAGCVDQILLSTSIETEPYSGIFDPVELSRIVSRAHSLTADDCRVMECQGFDLPVLGSARICPPDTPHAESVRGPGRCRHPDFRSRARVPMWPRHPGPRSSRSPWMRSRQMYHGNP